MKYGFISSLIAFSFMAEATITSEWTKITQLYPTASGLMFNTVYKNTDVSKCEGGTRFLLNPANADYQLQASVLIAAFMSNKEVMLYIAEAPAACTGLVDRFRVKPKGSEG